MKNKHADIFHRQGKGLIMDELRKQHDDLLANKPEEMSDGEFAALIEDHAKTCPFCNDKLIAEDNNDTDPEGGDMDKTFTQEELIVLQQVSALIKNSSKQKVLNKIIEKVMSYIK